MEDITDVDYTHANMFFKIYENGPAKFLSALGLACQPSLKTTKI